MAFDRLLRPRSIAVIGGGAWGASVIRQCLAMGFMGDVWPVHPSRAEVGGVVAVPRVEDLPGVPDAAFVGVNRAATVEVVGALSAMGCGGAVAFASGFSEAVAEIADGADLQAELVAVAGEMVLLGPNCYGLINALDRVALWPDFHGAVPVERGVAMVLQSSNLAINVTMQMRGLPLAYVVTAGNQAQVDLAGIGMALLNDERVTALGLYVEGIGDIRRFEALAAAARAAGKSIIALKAGATEHSQSATVSHTAALTGSFAGAAALFSRLGVGQVDSLSELLEALKIAHVTGPLASRRIASISCSGGEASLMADTGARLGLEFPALDGGQETALRAALGPKVALANPLDYHTYIWGDGAAIERCFTAMMTDDHALGCVVLDYPRPDRITAPDWDLVVDAVAATARATGRPMALVSTLPETMPEAVAQAAMDQGIVPLAGMGDALKAIRVMAGMRAEAPAPVLLPGPERIWAGLNEAEAKGELAEFGLDVPKAARAATAEAAAEAAAAMGGPVVLKTEGAAHKTETGGVVLGLEGARAVRAAAEAMGSDRFLVEEMIAGGVAELLIGVLRDPAHGFVLTLGAGGTLTELWRDTTTLLLPVTAAEIEAGLNRLRIAPLLNGYRGAPAANAQAIIDAVLAVQAYVTDHSQKIAEVEINPLICTPTRAVAADALIVRGA